MKKREQQQKAKGFLELHTSTKLFILPNAWDVSSAKIFELEGFKAIGTTSAGVASTLGYRDGQKMSLAESLEVVMRITDQIDVPVSVDIEAGYAATIEGIVKNVQKVLKVGAVGINLEDSTGKRTNPLVETGFQVEAIAAIREMTKKEGIDLLINARADAFMFFPDDTRFRVSETILRANAYIEAGADCIFIPDVGDLDKESIQLFIKEIDAPINLIAGATTPSISELQELGVSRVSIGPRAMRATFGLLKRISQELLTTGTYELLDDNTYSYGEVNKWFKK